MIDLDEFRFLFAYCQDENTGPKDCFTAGCGGMVPTKKGRIRITILSALLLASAYASINDFFRLTQHSKHWTRAPSLIMNATGCLATQRGAVPDCAPCPSMDLLQRPRY